MVKLFSISFFVLSIALSGMFVNAGKFYKWVDEQGNTHYAQNRPAEAAVSVVRTYNAQPIKVETSPEQLKKQQALIAPTTKTEAIKKDKALCQQAKSNIKVLMSRPMIMQEGKLMTIEEKNKQVKSARDIVTIHC